MTNKKSSKTLTLALGTAFAASMAASNVATAQTSNPFAMNELSSGYMQLADNHMEGRCGGNKKEVNEGKCGEGKKAEKEGKCGGEKEMKKNMEGNCGTKKSEKEGKCGEGKCGSNK